MLKKTLLNLLVLFTLFSCSLHACFAVSQVEAEQMLAKARNDLCSAYASVTDAESVGANVSDLLAKLAFAGTSLASANNSYATGDYENAYSSAANCSDAVSNMVNEASALKVEAENTNHQKLVYYAEFSSIGLSVLFVLSLFGWRFLRKRHLKRTLEMKLEVEAEAR